MVYDVRHVIGLFDVSPPVSAPHIVNVIHLGCYIIWMYYVSCLTLGLIVQDSLMLVFGTLTEIVIIITILFHRLFFFCVCTHSCSTDTILVVLRHLRYHLIGIFSHYCDYDIHIYVDMALGPDFTLSPTDVVSVVSDLAEFA